MCASSARELGPRVANSLARLKQEQGGGGEQRDQPQHRVHQPDHDDEDRHPRRIEECRHALVRDEVLNLLEVVQRLDAAVVSLELGPDVALEIDGRQVRIEPPAEAHGNGAAQRVEHAHDEHREAGDDGQKHEGFAAARAKHAVDHLQHVERRRQHQNIYDEAENGDRPQRRPAFADRSVDFQVVSSGPAWKHSWLCNSLN